MQNPYHMLEKIQSNWNAYSVSWWFKCKRVQALWRSVTASYNTEHILTTGPEISLPGIYPSKMKTHANKNPLQHSGSFTGALILLLSLEALLAMLFIILTSESSSMVL